MGVNLTVAIISRNSEETIGDALESVKWVKNILIVDSGSTDKTIKIGRKYTDNIVVIDTDDFSKKRNVALENLRTEWVFYLDVDEVVTAALKKEIQQVVCNDLKATYKVTRHNYFLGKRMYDDQVERLFHRSEIKRWRGKVHETPEVLGEILHLKNPLKHFTHRDISSMLEKTNKWSETEVELRMKAGHPKVAWWRLVRIWLTVWWEQMVKRKVWKFGREGWFEGYFQMVDKLIVYTKLWERQRG